MSLGRRPLRHDQKLAQIYNDENQREEKLRELALGEYNFNDLPRDFAIASDEPHPLKLAEQQQVQQEFVQQKKQLGSMAAKFALSMQPEYVDAVSIAEIGLTTSADHVGEIDALKTQWRELLGQLVANRAVVGELQRSDATRDITSHQTICPDYVALARTRKLADGTMECGNGPINFTLAKRMVFLMPRLAYQVISSQSDKFGMSETELVEQQLDTQNRHITPVRTAYYRLRNSDI